MVTARHIMSATSPIHDAVSGSMASQRDAAHIIETDTAAE